MLTIDCFWWFILEQTEEREGNGLDIIVCIYFFGEDFSIIFQEPVDGI